MQASLFNIDTAVLTSRTVIRRFREGEGKAFYELLQTNRSYLEDHFSTLLAQVPQPEQAEIFVRQAMANWLLQHSYAFGVWHTGDAKLIGYVHFREIDWDIPAAELSYFLDYAYTGQGIMTEVIARMVQYAFRQLKLDKLRLRTLIDNYASQRLARKVGFRREGDLRNEYRKPAGNLVDIMLFGLTREEYGA
ncbi:MAG: N-acetyltransferase [Bacteroidetes bacterium]|nr:MAG: N-acetyltransferase [Bacteroidota bacterium]